MNKISISLFFLVLGFASSAQNNDEVIMTVGDRPVGKIEFETVFHKNNSVNNNDAKSVRDYADLYAMFKRKVIEAESLGLDTLNSFKIELGGYRKQLSAPYLTDKNTNESLITEAYERMKYEIRAAHILIRCNESDFPKDTLEAWTRANHIRNALMGKFPTPAQIAEYEKLVKASTFGKKDTALTRSKVNSVKNLSDYYKKAGADKFTGIAPRTSDDPSVVDNKGDLNYFTAFDMVYPFENAAYNTNVGEISQLVRTRFGYHILKVYDKRPYNGEMIAAHIMVKIDKDANENDKTNAKTKVDELAKKLKEGKSFEEVAREFSDDKQTAAKGGQLAPFKAGRLPIEFETAAFALKNNNDISSPVLTKYGWHIIKRIDKKELAPFNEIKTEVKMRVQRDSRSQAGKTALIARVKKENNFKENLKNRDELIKVLDSTYLYATWTSTRADKLGNKEIISLGDKKYGQSDFARFLETQMVFRSKTDLKPLMDQIYQKWIDELAVTYEDNLLESKYPDFKNLLKEYRDGILLFDLTDQKVWSKAVRDTLGLNAFYEKNKNNYMWAERADVTTYKCANDKIADEVRKLIKKGKSEKEITETINKVSQLNVSVENVTYLKGENKNVEASWQQGLSKNNFKDPNENKTLVIMVNKILPKSPKSIAEARGMVTADYQSYLEKEWIEYLTKKYPLKINESVLTKVK